MRDFLLELRSEEIPARMQEKARENLARLFSAELEKAGLSAREIVTYATPRRLALIARDLPLQTEAVREELKGPRTSAPPQALEGFLRKTGLTQDALVEREGVWFGVVDRPGRATAEVLAEAIPAIIRDFPWPKSMRWGAGSLSTESLRWVRPLQGIVAILGEDVVPFEVAGVKSGAATVGHRFHHPGIITIGGAHDYCEKLRACHVIVDGAERRNVIALGATMAARKAGLSLVEDEGLLTENAGLTEWPVPLLGRFDPDFLSVPPEVIQLTARVNQKYFICRDGDGKLANAFVCTANIDARDGGEKIVEGNRKVLAARLSDARFFYETDLKTRLEDQLPKLSKIVFHERLGTVADKVERIARLARWLVEEGIVTSKPRPDPSPEGEGLTQDVLAALAERAARLCKADLVTGMVGEFPELQGLMGGYYAAAQGEHPAVAEAIRDHYKPVGQGDEVPTAPVTVAVSLADKLDSIIQFFGADMKPSGSKDPFALRRSALGVIALILDNGLRFPLARAVSQDVLDFFADRLKVQQREAGVRHDLIDAVFALGGEDDLVRLLARVKALQAFIGTEDGANLLIGYKRAANILKKEGWDAWPSAAPREAGGDSRRGGSDGTEVAGPSDPSARAAGSESTARHADERANFARDAQAPPPQDGSASPFAGAQPDDIPMTGEEDPLVEVEDPDFAPIVAAFARTEREKKLSYTPEPAEKALMDALDTAEPRAARAVRAEDFEGAMAALASLRAPIDAFFDQVTVNDPDPVKRQARLALLARMRDAVHRVADFSKIEG